ncbi:META domain-containing protein [Leucobacter chromiireducens]|uniref:META domain-containing protein n=1 Tax=Leucobacter chromiireducens subsp. solipictus TaxID=398235 RepID=A0ABS1SGM5_9MICO|nr:META domain-containing protein [Leucobacter chromiireducens]MBL3679680.1 META domain-containing protein [Leucobacter chromiireducens subsp. solipictus]
MTETRDALWGGWESAEPGTPGLNFEPSGTVRGSDGCNEIVSTYRRVAGGAQIAPAVMTARACIGVDQWLAAAAEVRLVGDRLRVYAADGRPIGWLTRRGTTE